MLRVLLDEDVDVRLRAHFSSSIDVQTVAFLGWKGKSNGELLRAAEGSFDVLLTLDTRLPSQQNLSQYDLAVIVLRPRTQKLDELITMVPAAEDAASSLQPGTFMEVHPPTGSQ
jgi:hypothetical protein